MSENTYRIGKFLAHLGLCSRRDAAAFMEENSISYEGRPVHDLNLRIPQTAVLVVNGKNYRLEQVQVVLLNKPVGYVCTHREQRGQKSIFQLLPPEMSRYFYAGRLDAQSRGLVVLSNNGDLIYELTHPGTETVKIYHVHSSRPLSPDEIFKIKKGVWSKGEKLTVDLIKPLDQTARYEIHLHEGKNREIRRIFESLGLAVLDLNRLKVANYSVEGIEEGSYKTIQTDFP